MKDRFMVHGYVINYSEGTYSDRWEQCYWFKVIPDMGKMQDEISKVYEESPGNYNGNMTDKIQDIIEKYGGMEIEPIAYVWTDDYGTDDTSFKDRVNDTERHWREK